MNKLPFRKKTSMEAIENASARLLIEKMGISESEFYEINLVYGVSASKLLELMQLSKYPFIYTGKATGQCEMCNRYYS